MMRNLLSRHLIVNKKTNVLFILVFFIIFTCAPIALHSITSITNQVNTSIIENARGSYDLLVRHPNSIQPIEKTLKRVPENYLGGGQGGISQAQWEKILNRDDIEIAAPVASIGYFSGVQTTLGILPSPTEASLYQVDYLSSDGVNTYIADSYQQIFLETQDSYHDLEILVNDITLFHFMDPRRALFPLPATYHHLVGIDPIEEEKLTGINFSGISFGEENRGSAYGFGSSDEFLTEAHIIPVLQLQDSHINLKAKNKYGALPFTSSDTEKFYEKLEHTDYEYVDSFLDLIFEEVYPEIFTSIAETELIDPIIRTVDLSSYLHPFNVEGRGLVISEDNQIYDIEEYGSEENYGWSHSFNYLTHYYTAQPVEYLETESGLEVNQIDAIGEVPIYRYIEEHGITILDRRLTGEALSVMTDPVGYFEVSEREEELSSSPLGIYQLQPVLFTDELGETIIMTPTFTPGSFVSAPAEGVTNIEAASFVKGEVPIDAIRVKVSGFDDYSPEASTKIEQVANDIESMGLHVDIVAGSSTERLEIEVEGVGKVYESWTTIGAANEIVSQWNLTNLILAALFLIVALTTLLSRLTIWHRERAMSIQRLKLLGWRYKDIKKLYFYEIITLLIISILLSLAVTLVIFRTSFELVPIVLYQSILFILGSCLTVYLFYQKMNSQLDIEKDKKNAQIKKTRFLFTRNIYYYKETIKPIFIQVFIIGILAIFVYISISSAVSQTNHTVLGQYVNAGVNQMTQILIFSSYLLAFINISENISTMMINRRNEISTYKIIGWSFNDIKRNYLQEISLWSSIALLLGGITSLILFAIFYPITVVNILMILMTIILIFTLIMITCYSLISWSLKH